MLIQKGYKILELDTYFTSGPEETRAWTIQKNCTAPKAAGEIHTDFEKGFIRAETISYEDFITYNGWVASKETIPPSTSSATIEYINSLELHSKN